MVSLENFLHEFKHVHCDISTHQLKEDAIEFACRVRKSIALQNTFIKTARAGVKIVLGRKFDVHDDTIYIDMAATDTEIIKFLWGNALI